MLAEPDLAYPFHMNIHNTDHELARPQQEVDIVASAALMNAYSSDGHSEQ